MQWARLLSAAVDLARVKYLKRKVPVAVRFQLTHRCDHRCNYCTLWNDRAPELDTATICALLRQMKEAGTKKISFSGGEPLLRNDIEEIVRYTKELGISPEMNSRGALIDKKQGAIQYLDLLKISINGTEAIHDEISGRKGAYAQAIHAVEVAQKLGVRVSFAATLTKQNIDHLDDLLDLARTYNTFVAFQPLKTVYRGIEDLAGVSPDPEAYTRAIEKLIMLKKAGNRSMRNSLIGLEYIRRWPHYEKLPCAAGRLFCVIEPNGDVYPCDRVSYKTESIPNAVAVGFQRAIRQLPDTHCGGCGFCGSLELSFLLNLKLGTLASVWHMLYDKKKRKTAGVAAVSNALQA